MKLGSISPTLWTAPRYRDKAAVCPVVWEGWRREASPIPIFGAELPALQAKRQVSPPKLTFESASFE